MLRINQVLLDRLAEKLEVSKTQVYAHIQKVHNKTFLDRNLAALKLAADLGINIHKYSTSEERNQLRSAATLDAKASGRNDTGSDHNLAPRPRSSGKQAAVTKHRVKDNSVFVVHGRNEALRKSLFDFLRALGLNPREWNQALLMAKGANPFTLEVIDAAMAKVQAVVVLFSPDDETRLKQEYLGRNEKKSEGQLRGQPRPNVIFEAGLALGRHPEKTLLVQIGEVRGFTDILGKHIPKLTNDVSKRNDIANRLQKIGCKVDTSGNDWRTTGDFSA